MSFDGRRPRAVGNAVHQSYSTAKMATQPICGKSDHPPGQTAGQPAGGRAGERSGRKTASVDDGGDGMDAGESDETTT